MRIHILVYISVYISSRDDDNDIDEDDDRVEFSVNAAERDRQHMKDRFLAAEHGSDEDSDKERDEWEQQQLQKVVGGRAEQVSLLGWSSVLVVWCLGGIVSGWSGVRVARCLGGLVSAGLVLQ